jgi:aminoglycoside phosphotransferase (APT) family kinase protein
MNLPQNFADVDKAREIALSLYPNAQGITMIEHSADNIVALVDGRCVLRFPRGKDAYLRGLYEKHALRKLEAVKRLTIPRILDENASPPYVITSFVPGHLISSATIRTLPQNHQQDFAKLVAKFAYTMHTSFDMNEEKQLRKKLGLDNLATGEPWPSHYKRVVRNGYFPNPAQAKIAKECYAKWVKYCDVTPTVVVHDDLHTENMMFNDDNRLIGILDFGDTNVGTPEQELRQLYRINEAVMLAAVQEYQRLSGHQLNLAAIKLWAIMKELAVYSRRLAAKATDHHSFKRASRNLNTWLPKGECGKGYDLSDITATSR